MANNELKLIVSGDGRRLRSTLSNASREISSFANKSSRYITGLHNKIGSGLMRIIKNPLAQVASAAGIMALGKQLVNFEADVLRVGIQGKLSAKETLALKDAIIETAIASGNSREDVLSGVNAIVERSGDITFAKEVMNDLAIAATATGAAVGDMGALASNLHDKLDIDAPGMMDVLNTLTVQGKAGAFTLQNMAAMGERLFSAAGNLGMKGAADLKKFGALIQVARMGTGSSEQATTSIERVLSNIIAKQDIIAKKGFDVFSNKKLQQYKSIDEIIKGTIKSVGGNQKTLQEIFGEEGIRGVSTLARLYRETGGFDLYDKLAGADAESAGELLKDFARYSESAAFQFSVLTEVGKKFVGTALSSTITNLTQKMTELTSEPKKMAAFQGQLDKIAKSIGDIGNAAVALTPLLKIIGFLSQGVTGWEEYIVHGTVDGVDPIAKMNNALLHGGNGAEKRLFDLPIAALPDKSLERVAAMMHSFPVNNNITINQDADGRIRSVTSDSLNTNNHVAVNRGVQTARQ